MASNEFKTKQAISLMVEMEMDLVDKQMWEHVISKPVESVQMTVGKQNNVLSSWGTRYWNEAGKISTPPECTKVTTNVLIPPESLEGILKLSGTTLWVSPRQGQDVYHNYRPIWVRGNLAECRRKHDTVLHAMGIIKGARGYAVRIPNEHVDEAKKTLYPGQPLQPSLNPTEQVCMYKVSPTPLGATQEDVDNFLRSALPSYTIQGRRQIGPTSWLIAVNGTIQEDYVAMKEGYLVLQEWRTGRNQDTFRRAVLVGNPKVLRRASEAVGHVLAAEDGEFPQQIVPQRPAPQGPVQQLVSDRNRETEDRITAMLNEHKKQTDQRMQDLQARIEENKGTNDRAIEELRTNQLGHQQALERVEQTTKKQTQAIESQMSEPFATLLREIRGMKSTPEGKRTPAPSPESLEPSKTAKTS